VEERQIISQPGAPTCLGSALKSRLFFWKSRVRHGYSKSVRVDLMLSHFSVLQLFTIWYGIVKYLFKIRWKGENKIGKTQTLLGLWRMQIGDRSDCSNINI